LTFPVSDAGPLIALGRINHLHLLPELFEQIIIPEAVFREVTSQVELPGAMQLKRAAWLQTHVAQDIGAVERLLFWLEQGESEAIILAQRLNSTLLMDERRGRSIATTMGLRVAGSVGILIAAKQHRLIPEVTPFVGYADCVWCPYFNKLV
jgi:uncharacterized protein